MLIYQISTDILSNDFSGAVLWISEKGFSCLTFLNLQTVHISVQFVPFKSFHSFKI